MPPTKTTTGWRCRDRCCTCVRYVCQLSALVVVLATTVSFIFPLLDDLLQSSSDSPDWMSDAYSVVTNGIGKSGRDIEQALIAAGADLSWFMNTTSMFGEEDDDAALDSVGVKVKQHYNATAKHPIVFVPGIVTTGLEIWKARACAGKQNFRSRIWGSTLMFRKLLLARDCWLSHMSLNRSNWRDPNGIQLRACEGLAAADFWLGDYKQFWVWGRLIEELAEIGYTERSMHMASYDWRIAFDELERRDHYFSRLKSHVELNSAIFKEKTYFIAHSMGFAVAFHFLSWVQSRHGGGGGSDWVANHLAGLINVGGPVLGVPKAVATLLSGEMRNTAQLPPVLAAIKDNFVTRSEVSAGFKTLGSLPSMWPRGGAAVWGGALATTAGSTTSSGSIGDKDRAVDGAPAAFVDVGKPPADYYTDEDDDNGIEDDEKCAEHAAPPVAADDHWHTRKYPNTTIRNLLLTCPARHDIGAVFDLVSKVSPRWGELTKQHYSMGARLPKYDEISVDNIPVDDDDDATTISYLPHRRWTNPLEVPLPLAPKFRMLCLYGVGKATERSYHYVPAPTRAERCSDVPICINTTKHEYDDGEEIGAIGSTNVGIDLSDGDGTVPLISLGYMCAHGWHYHKTLNGAGIKPVVREYKHKTIPLLDSVLPSTNLRNYLRDFLRGDGQSAEHVNLMGNEKLLHDILVEVSTANEQLDNSIVSDIGALSEKVAARIDEAQKFYQ